MSETRVLIVTVDDSESTLFSRTDLEIIRESIEVGLRKNFDVRVPSVVLEPSSKAEGR